MKQIADLAIFHHTSPLKESNTGIHKLQKKLHGNSWKFQKQIIMKESGLFP